MMEEKICNHCKRLLPLEKFSKNKNSKDGYNPRCKDCESEAAKLYYEKNKEKLKAKTRDYYNDHQEEKCAYQRAYRTEHPDYMKAYRKAHPYNPEERKERYLANKEKENAQSLKWNAENKDRVLARRRERYANDEKYRINQMIIRHRREAKEHNVKSDFSYEDWTDMLKFFDNECAYCGNKESLEFDHVIPLSKSGWLTRTNIIPSCKSCNSRKYTANLEDWYTRQPFFSEDRLERINAWTNQATNELGGL